MSTADEALERLIAGNHRFVQNEPTDHPIEASRLASLDKQTPFAIILGCSDSRVPVELVFDQGLGDLFVVRVAGNIATPSQLGSVEFAATQFGCSLVVVLGHSRCGAVKATLDALQQDTASPSPNLAEIVERITPAVQSLATADSGSADLLDQAVRANVQGGVKALLAGSTIIEELVADRALRVIGAHYALDSGQVEFFDEG